MQFQLNQFSGPLDLLLTLLQEEKLDVGTIALGEVTEQYLQYLDTLEERRADELADFLVIAARLLLLKSSNLLPQFGIVEDEGPSLEDQLRLYKQFVDASKKFNRLWLCGLRTLFRFEPPRVPTSFVAPVNMTLDSLHERMIQLVRRLEPPKPLPETHVDRAVSMKQKIDDIRRLLVRTTKINFFELLADAKNKTEIIVSFLALLELVKQKIIHVDQQEGFGDIVIQKLENVK